MSERPQSQSDIQLFDATENISGTLLQINASENGVNDFNDFATPLNMVIGSDGRFTYSSHVSNTYEKEYWWIPMDHCYSRPWNWRPESAFLRPTKMLFMPKPSVKKKVSLPETEEQIDVLTEPEPPIFSPDKAKARQVMEDCERHASLARPDDGNDEWEEAISRINWTTTQNRLFAGMVTVLNNDYLARLAHTNSRNEVINRRLTIDKSVERVRRLMATVSWEPKYTQWLHQLLIDNLSKQYLGAYLDILQTLKSKVPSFVDKMMSGAITSRLSMLGYDSLFPLLKRPWEPVIIQEKPKKLPGNAVIVVVPSSPLPSRRIQKWLNLLANLGTVVSIPLNYNGSATQKTTMVLSVDQMFIHARTKLHELRLDYPGKNIILVGFNSGSNLALQLAQVEQIFCVISVGFSLYTAEGKRGEPDDNLLELQCPVLFVVGQCSSTSLQEEMEDLRERMRVETGLVIVGSADDKLRINKKRMRIEGITQSVVDRCVVEEIGEFISGVLLSPFPPQIRQSPINLASENKKAKTERQRYNSNTSSVDSEPPSPTPRITRPGQNSSPSFGRPPGSKTKSKWAMQGTPLSPSISPPPLIMNTPDTSSNDSTDKNLIAPELPVKKLKTLKPTISSPEKHTVTTTQPPPLAKAVSYQNRCLASLLQGDLQQGSQPHTSKSGIKVLENVKLSSGGINKYMSTAKMMDMSKISMINAKANGGKSIVLLPDGQIKALSCNSRAGGKYITSKRQLIGNKPPKPLKKLSYMPQVGSTLPPPTNLTTQDIMDLPIIFADDNQILENPIDQELKVPPLIQTHKASASTSGNKFVLLNKPNVYMANTKRPSAQGAKAPPKYTKIIFSSKKGADVSSVVSKISNLSPEISIKRLAPSPRPPVEDGVDLETEIAASTLYKVPSTKREESYDDVGDDLMHNYALTEANMERGVKRRGEDLEPEGTDSKVQKLEQES